MCRLAHHRIHLVPWLGVTAALVVAAACQDVSVTTVAADRIEIDPTTAQVQVDQTVRFTARVLSETGQVLSGRSVAWTSLQPEVAAIDGDGTAHALAPGTAVIRATSEGASVDGTVTVTAGPVPAIAAAPQELAFSAVEDGPTPGDRAVTVTNSGTGNLTGLSAVISYAAGQPTGWLSAGLSSTSAPTVLLVSANQGGLPPGAYTATINVSAPGAANSPVTVSVSLAVSPKQQPAIGLGRTSVDFSAVAGGANPPSQTVSVTNQGGGTLGGLSTTISYLQGTGWLTASLSGTTAPATLTLTAATGSLAAGTYNATVQVNSSQAANSPQQIQVSFTVASGAPGAPSNLTATPVSSSRIDLAWTASTGVVQRYRIQRKLASGGAYAQIDSVSGATTTYQNTGLLPATGYVYRVEACSAAGCSGWSNEAAATTGLQPVIGLSTNSITFSAVAGGANPPSQTVSVTNQGGGTLGGLSTTISYLQGTGWLTASLSGTTAPATLTLTAATGSLAAGTYNATVQVNSSQATNSPQQIQVSFTVASGAPGAPSNLTATAVSESQIDLAWTASAGVVQQYRIQRKLAVGGAYAQIDSVSGGTTTYQNTGLLPATGYVYRVEACSAAGCSGWSNEAAATTGLLPAIGLSTTSVGFSATAGGANPQSQEVAVTNQGGGILGGLSATIDYVGEAGWLTASLSGTTAPATLTLTAATGSLVPGTYNATVQVHSILAANSPQQIQVSFTIASASAPGAPSNLTATPVSSSRIDLAWTASAGVVQQYRIQRRPEAGGDFAQIDSVSGGTTTYQNTGLLPATGYVYRVEACSAVGCSEWSNEASATTSLAPPSAPGDLTGTALSSTEIQLSWTAPGGQTRYEIRRRIGNGQWTIITTAVPGDATTYVDSGLTPSTTYQYQVRACDEDACSDFSNVVSVSTGA